MLFDLNFIANFRLILEPEYLWWEPILSTFHWPDRRPFLILVKEEPPLVVSWLCHCACWVLLSHRPGDVSTDPGEDTEPRKKRHWGRCRNLAFPQASDSVIRPSLHSQNLGATLGRFRTTQFDWLARVPTAEVSSRKWPGESPVFLEINARPLAAGWDEGGCLRENLHLIHTHFVQTWTMKKILSTIQIFAYMISNALNPIFTKIIIWWQAEFKRNSAGFYGWLWHFSRLS